MSGKKWTEQEIEFLISNFDTMKIADIAKILKRSYCAVHNYAVTINLVKYNRWKDDDIKFVEKNKKDMSCKEMAEYLNRTVKSVESIVYRRGDKYMQKSKKPELSSRKSVFDWLYKNASGLTKNEAIEAIKEIKQLANQAGDISSIYEDYDAWRKEYMQTKDI